MTAQELYDSIKAFTKKADTDPVVWVMSHEAEKYTSPLTLHPHCNGVYIEPRPDFLPEREPMRAQEFLYLLGETLRNHREKTVTCSTGDGRINDVKDVDFFENWEPATIIINPTPYKRG